MIMGIPCLQAQNDEFAAIFNLEDYKGRLHLVVVSMHYLITSSCGFNALLKILSLFF